MTWLAQHTILHIVVIMSKVKSYLLMLDLECEACVLDIFVYLYASVKDEHPATMLSRIKSILTSALGEVDDLVGLLLPILSHTHHVAAMTASSITLVISLHVLQMSAFSV